MKELFQKIDFFNDLDERILKKVAEAAILKRYGKDEAVVRQGETGLGMYIIVRGHVKVEHEQDGKRVKVAELGTEATFAEMGLLDNKPRSAHVITTEETELLLLTRDSFVKLMAKYPEIPIKVARVLADRLRDANEKIATGAATGHTAPAASAPAPATPPAQAAPLNGDTAPPAEPGSGMSKNQIQQSLLDAFANLYTIKAFTRFSVAVLGCPVEASGPAVVETLRCGDVKVFLLPAGQPAHLDLQAGSAGVFQLHVFTPQAASPAAFGPLAIAPADAFRLNLNGDAVSLYNGKTRVA